MKILVLDSTAVRATPGPGAPAHFSQPAIAHLRRIGHEVTIVNGYDDRLCAAADAVWTEWCNEDAFEAARSGVCKRLIVRMRGFDAHGPLDRLEWANVDALVYESPFLQQLVEERFPGLRGIRSHVIPSGVDLERFKFKERKPNRIVALVARATSDKGQQLALEWARQREDIKLHITTALGESNPRLLRYLKMSAPSNVTIHGDVDPAAWIDEIDASYIASFSIWETLGYSIAEGMAMGCKPLIHAAPGTLTNWPETWTSLSDLDWMVGLVEKDEPYFPRGWRPVQSRDYRTYVEEHLDAAKLSVKFADLLLSLPAREPKPIDVSSDIVLAGQALAAGRLDIADAAVSRFRQRVPPHSPYVDDRAGMAYTLAAAYFNADAFEEAATWALRSLREGARRPAMALLGEVAAIEGRVEEAARWYEAATGIDAVASRYVGGPDVYERLTHFCAQAAPQLTEAPPVSRFLIVVPVRNAEKWIERCLDSIERQTENYLCIVADDCSTDGTREIVQRYTSARSRMARLFIALENIGRRYSLANLVTAIGALGKDGDVIVIVDGDDWLGTPYEPHTAHVLSTLDQYYRRGAWLTYGNFTVHPTGAPSWMPPYPIEVARAGAFRSYPWRVSHPKTFRYELFKRVDPDDFQHEGKWFTTAGDVALMLPMLEMACERAVYVPEPLYVYNMETAEQDHKTDPDGQVRARDLIYAKKRYERLETL